MRWKLEWPSRYAKRCLCLTGRLSPGVLPVPQSPPGNSTYRRTLHQDRQVAAPNVWPMPRWFPWFSAFQTPPPAYVRWARCALLTLTLQSPGTHSRDFAPLVRCPDVNRSFVASDRALTPIVARHLLHHLRAINDLRKRMRVKCRRDPMIRRPHLDDMFRTLGTPKKWRSQDLGRSDRVRPRRAPVIPTVQDDR